MTYLAGCIACLLAITFCAGCSVSRSTDAVPTSPGESELPSFASLKTKIARDEPIRVVFFGGSLTWGANASDPQVTSYRGRIQQRLQERYPGTQFRFYDAAIGGTGSRVGLFRLQRDVLDKMPDLVFLDFTANDNIRAAKPSTLTSYEQLVRRLITDGDAVVISVILPFKGDAAQGDTADMPGRDGTIAIAEAYNLPIADAVVLAQERLKSSRLTPDDLWPWDGAHPNDHGYEIFADAAWRTFEEAMKRGIAMRVPEQPMHGDGYRHVQRIDLAELFESPEEYGWRVDSPSRVAAWYDGLMSRWLDSVLVAGGKQTSRKAESMHFTFRARELGMFGEQTVTSGKYRVLIDGEVVEPKAGHPHFDASSEQFGGNLQHLAFFASELDESIEHKLVIEPILEEEQELRLGALFLSGSRETSVSISNHPSDEKSGQRTPAGKKN